MPKKNEGSSLIKSLGAKNHKTGVLSPLFSGERTPRTQNPYGRRPRWHALSKKPPPVLSFCQCVLFPLFVVVWWVMGVFCCHNTTRKKKSGPVFKKDPPGVATHTGPLSKPKFLPCVVKCCVCVLFLLLFCCVLSRRSAPQKWGQKKPNTAAAAAATDDDAKTYVFLCECATSTLLVVVVCCRQV